MPSAAPSGTAMTKATTTSAAVTPSEACTSPRPRICTSAASTSESGGSSMALTRPSRGSASHRRSTAASSPSRTMMSDAPRMPPRLTPSLGRNRRELGGVDFGRRRQVLHADELGEIEGAVDPLLLHLAGARQLEDVAVELGFSDVRRDLVDFRDELDRVGAVRLERGHGAEQRIVDLLDHLGLLGNQFV